MEGKFSKTLTRCICVKEDVISTVPSSWVKCLHAKNTQSLGGTQRLSRAHTGRDLSYLESTSRTSSFIFMHFKACGLPTAHSHLPYTRTLHIMEERRTYHCNLNLTLFIPLKCKTSRALKWQLEKAALGSQESKAESITYTGNAFLQFKSPVGFLSKN